MITPGMVRKGYVEHDGVNDTHGFRKTGKQVWVEYAHEDVHPDFKYHRRSLWVDYLGDYFVRSLDGDQFVHFDGYGEIADWEWVDMQHPNVLPERWR